MVFKPGQTGNPHGRGAKELQRKRLASELLTDYVKDAVAVVADMLKHGESSDRQWAATLVFAYVFGRPGQIVELQGKDGAPLTAVLNIGHKPEQLDQHQ